MHCFDIFFPLMCAWKAAEISRPKKKKKFLETLLIAWLGRGVPQHILSLWRPEKPMFPHSFAFFYLHTHACFQPGLETLKLKSSVPGKEKEKKTTKNRLMCLLLWSLIRYVWVDVSSLHSPYPSLHSRMSSCTTMNVFLQKSGLDNDCSWTHLTML